MKILPAVLLFVILSFQFLGVNAVKADYNQTYSDYQFLYSQYRKSFDEYTVAKATYQTYRTLTTQNDALEKMRTTLTDRANIVGAYLNLIYDKMTVSEGIPLNELTSYAKIKSAQESWLSSHKKLISGAATLEDLNAISHDFDTRYLQIKDQTNKAVAIILLSKNDYAYAKMPDLFNRLQAQLSRLPAAGEDNLTHLRGLDVARSKAQLWEDKRAEILTVMNPKQYSYQQALDIGKIQNLLFGGLQYLKESTSYLNEIVGSITKPI